MENFYGKSVGTLMILLNSEAACRMWVCSFSILSSAHYSNMVANMQ